MHKGSISEMGSQRLVWLIHVSTLAVAGVPCAMPDAGCERHFVWTRSARPSGYTVRSLRPGLYPVPASEAARYACVGRVAPTKIEVGLDLPSGNVWAHLHFESAEHQLAVAA